MSDNSLHFLQDCYYSKNAYYELAFGFFAWAYCTPRLEYHECPSYNISSLKQLFLLLQEAKYFFHPQSKQAIYCCF